MREFVTKNTKKRVVINVATMGEVKELKKQILLQLKNHQLGLNLTGNVNNLLEKEIPIGRLIEFLKDVVIGMDTSEGLDRAIYNCLGHCTYNTVNVIDENLFDTICPEAREDYYEIIFACVEENLKPFMKSLCSEWNTIAMKIGNIPTLNVIANNVTL